MRRRESLRLWGLLSAWAALWVLPHLWRPTISWHFFDAGARLLFESDTSGGGLGLYAAHPNLQIGPLAFVAAAPLRVADPWHGRVVAPVAMTALGVVLLWLIRSLSNHGVGSGQGKSFALAGFVFLPVWTEVAVHYAHLDDVLALSFAVLALHAVERERPVLAGVLLAFAADSKPWAVAFVPMLLALPPGRRLRAGVAWVGAVAAAWLPFLAASPTTLRVAAFTIPNAASSALRALGVHDPRTPPWDRPLQLVLGCLVAAFCVRTGRWPAVLFAAIAVRMLFDPQTYAYYTSGLVLAAVVVDLLIARRRVPLFTLSAVVTVYLARALPLDPHSLGLLRAAYCIGALAMLLLPRLARQEAARLRPLPAGGHPEKAAAPVEQRRAR